MRRGMDAAGFEPLEKSIRELQRAMAKGQVTSVQLVQFYIDRINAYDQVGPRLNAVIAINPHAAADARGLDDERRRKGPRGPMHGIPVLLKDNFDTKDMPTTGGALALSGIVPKDDAFQVTKLRDAGAVILGKVNLHELALGLTTVSSVGGQTLDPYDLTRAPGGSSGGSAVAATANFAAVTLGTDTAGSIRIPSAHNNVVGLRPSAGLSSRAGIIPFSYTQDTGGPIARTVEDIAIVLDATVGYDAADSVTATGNGKIPRTYTASLKRNALKGARIGVPTDLFGTAPEDAEVGTVVRRAIDEMKAHGAVTVDVAIPNLALMLTASNLLTQEIKAYLGGYLKKSGGPVASVEELLASGLHVAQLEGILNIANRTADDYLASDDYKRRLAARDTLGQAVTKVMDDNRLDALAYLRIDDPVGAWPVHGACGIWGTLSLGLFASGQFQAAGSSPFGVPQIVEKSPEALTGLFYGGGATVLYAQIVGSVIICTATFAAAMAMFAALNAFGLLRVSKEGEEIGLDVDQHGISAYPEYVISGLPAYSTMVAERERS